MCANSSARTQTPCLRSHCNVEFCQKSISKPNRNTLGGIRSVGREIDVKLPQLSSESIDLHWPTDEERFIKRSIREKGSGKEVSSVSRHITGSEQATPRKPNRKVRFVSIRKTSIDNHLIVIATPMNVDNWAEMKNKK